MTKKLAYLVVFSVCLLILLHPDSVVSAHVFLKSSQPAADQVIAQAPTQVVLVFSGDLGATGNQIAVTNAAGQHFETGNVTLDLTNPNTMTIALSPLPDGIYTVTYTAISAADGHDTTDNYRFGVGNVTLISNAPIRACILLPTLIAQANSQNASVRIVSPSDNSVLTSSHLDYTIQTTNFNLGSNGNYANVWVDGQNVQKIDSIGGHSLDLTSGIHDVCVALVDGVSGTEIGTRAGIRLSVSSNAIPQSSILLSVLVLIVGVAVAIVAAVLFLLYRRKSMVR